MGLVIFLRTLLPFLVAAAPVMAADLFDEYLRSHPETRSEDLLMVGFGDSLERVLAVVHHPDAGARVSHVRLLELGSGGTQPLSLKFPAIQETGPGTALILSVATRCPGNPAGNGASAVDSWFYLPGGELAGWSFQPYTKDCRPETPLFEASDHQVMQAIGEYLFQPTGRGRFRYGPLSYERWESAFAAPNRVAMLSLLRARVRPDDARTQNRLAVGLYAAGDRTGAVAALREAVRTDPHWDLPHRNLAVVHLQRGELEEAGIEMARARALATPAVGSGPPD